MRSRGPHQNREFKAIFLQIAAKIANFPLDLIKIMNLRQFFANCHKNCLKFTILMRSKNCLKFTILIRSRGHLLTPRSLEIQSHKSRRRQVEETSRTSLHDIKKYVLKTVEVHINAKA